MGSDNAPAAEVAGAIAAVRESELSILLVGLSMYVQLVVEDTPEFKALAKVEDVVERKRSASPILRSILYSSSRDRAGTRASSA